MALQSGTQLGAYRIVGPLGTGGMGEVYLAQDTRLDRKVALKLLPVEVASNQDRMRRFILEAKAAASLNHPNIAHVYEIGEADGQHFIAMEFVDGLTLREKIHRERTELRKLLKYLQQVAEGLSKAHAAGIVHRDLKPDNIMITSDGYAKILDFGLAKLIEPPATPGHRDAAASDVATAITVPGVVMGTVGYMSPEQARGKTNEIDQRSDIFSFGCILFEAATGHQPFAGDSVIKSLHKVVYEPAPPLTDFNPAAPADLQRIVRRCLAKDREERHQSIKDVAIELKELRLEMEGLIAIDTPVPPTRNHKDASPPSDQSAATQTASATSTQSASAAAPASSAEYIVQGLKRNKKSIFAAFALTVFAGVAFAIYQYALNPKLAPAHFERVKLTRITTEGNLQDVAVAPDGKYIAYTLLADGKHSLWTKHLATDSRVQIVAPAATIMSPEFFSHDGGYVFYSRWDEQNPEGALFQVAVLGGAPKKILTNFQSALALSPDGRQLAFGRSHSGALDQNDLWLANADGTNERQLRAFSAPEFFTGSGTAWSPDARLVTVALGSGEGGWHNTVAAVSVADGALRVITTQRWAAVWRIAWFGDGSGMAVVAQESATSDPQIWQVSYPDGAARRVTNDLHSYSTFSLTLTADSHTLVALQEEAATNIWVAPDGDAQRARAVTVSRKNVQDYGGEWTPDGRVVFGSNVGGGARIWLMNADGTEQKPLTQSGEQVSGAQVSPDGRYIFYRSQFTKALQVWRMDIDGSHPKQLTEGAGVASFYLTPDGGWVLYSLWTPPGIWKVSVEGGPPTKVSDASGSEAQVSPDGKLLAYSIEDEQTKRERLVVVRFDDGAPFKTFDLPVTAGIWHWSPDSRAFVYTDTQGSVSNLWQLPLDGARPAQISDFKSAYIYYFSYSRDGRQLVLSRGSETRDAVLISDEK